MKNKILLVLLLTGFLFSLQKSFGHCDTKNGPVVTAAKQALITNNVNLVLIWVPEKDERLIKEAFKNTVALRKINPEVQKAMDNYFFETLVRIHRAGEGIAYAGLKDSAEIEAPIAAADKALETRSVTEVLKLLNSVVTKGVNEKFADAVAKMNYDKDNIEAGREYVEQYVLFMHYVEGIYNAANASVAKHHSDEGNAAPLQHWKNISKESTSISPLLPSTSESDFFKYILIVSGVLLIVIIPVLLSYKHAF